MAKHLGTEHTEVILSPQDVLRLVPGLPSVYDEPFADSSQLPTQLVMRLARKHVTVALSGDGGDELFGGYNRYRLVPAAWSWMRWMPAVARSGIGSALLSVSPAKWDHVVGPIAARAGIAQTGDKLHKLGRRMRKVADADDLFYSLVSEWDEPTQVVRGASEPQTMLSNRSCWPPVRDQVARMMALDTLTYLPDDILVKVDRAAMAASLETRAPFLDHKVIEFAWRLPMRMKIRAGRGKWLLRQVLRRHVPDRLIDRPKMGFGIPARCMAARAFAGLGGSASGSTLACDTRGFRPGEHRTCLEGMPTRSVVWVSALVSAHVSGVVRGTTGQSSMTSTIRILAFLKYGDLAASTRQRVLQYVPHLQSCNIEVQTVALLDNEYVRQIGARGGRLAPGSTRIAKSYARRIGQILSASHYDAFWIHYELFPFVPGIAEALIFLHRKPVIYDFDDATFHTYDMHKSAIVRTLLSRKLEPLLSVGGGVRLWQRVSSRIRLAFLPEFLCISHRCRHGHLSAGVYCATR